MRWWRVFIDKISGKARDPGVVGPRRRRAPRYDYQVKLTARCSSWPKFEQLLSGNVSEGGLYVPTEQTAEVGETVEVSIELPDGGTFPVTGKVVNVIDAERAAAFGRPPGLGIALDPLEGAAKQRFDQVLAAARESAPVPEDTLDGQPVPQRPSTAPTGSLPTPVAEPPLPPPVPDKKDRVTFRDTTGQKAIGHAPRRAAASGGGPIIGLDLGTTYTSIAAVVGKKVSILPWPDGAKQLASVVSFPDKHSIAVGPQARRALATDPAHTVASPKRLLGRKFGDKEAQAFIGQAPYRTWAGPDDSIVVEIWGQQYAVTQLCSYIVEEAKKAAEAALGERVSRCVMTVPVSFDESRAAIYRRAGELAGLEVVSMIDEPSAAALANRFDAGFGGTVGVYDFGGGTFDFSLVDVSGGDFQVLATAGDTWLGGDDFDSVIAEAAANQFWRIHKVDLRKQAVEWQKLVFACERAKRMLSIEETTPIYVPGVLRGPEGMIDLNISIDRPTFERACQPVVERSLTTCDEALELLDMKRDELTTIYLSGGTTYIPTVRTALAAHFGVPVRTGVPPEHAVCLGSAIHAAQIQFQAATTLDARD